MLGRNIEYLEIQHLVILAEIFSMLKHSSTSTHSASIRREGLPQRLMGRLFFRHSRGITVPGLVQWQLCVSGGFMILLYD